VGVLITRNIIHAHFCAKKKSKDQKLYNLRHDIAESYTPTESAAFQGKP
jgi:hypothetical protein